MHNDNAYVYSLNNEDMYVIMSDEQQCVNEISNSIPSLLVTC